MSDFTRLWESARSVLGWAVFGGSENYGLVQLRGTYEKTRWRSQRNVILIQGEDFYLKEILKLSNANLAATAGALRSDLEQIDGMTSGSGVSVVLGDDTLGVWRTNGAHAGIILERIAARELDPSEDLLRCLRGTPSSAETLAAIDLTSITAKAGPGRVPTEEERVARLGRWWKGEGMRVEILEAFERGDEEQATELTADLMRFLDQSEAMRKAEFGDGWRT